MGSAGFASKSNAQLQRHIRTVAATTASIVITTHATARMRQRRIGINEVYECLRRGEIVRPPQINRTHDTLECRMERYVGGRDIAIVVALDDVDPDLIVVTVMIF